MAPSLETHLPVAFIDRQYCELVLFWVDRATGAMEFLFYYESARNYYNSTGISSDERKLLNGYSQEEADALIRSSLEQYPASSGERERVRQLADIWRSENDCGIELL